LAAYANLAGVEVGDGYPVRVMGVINVSPESFYKGSVVTDPKGLAERAARMLEEGASIIDLGARTTAPYIQSDVSPEEEARRLEEAVRLVKSTTGAVVSADTTRASVAERAIKAGADIINDVTGLKGDEGMVRVAREYGVPLILAAHERRPGLGSPVERVEAALAESLAIAASNDVEPRRVVIDPAIGFFRNTGIPWYQWDSQVIAGLPRLRRHGRPIAISVSRKSFIGHILGLEKPEDRLYGSLAATSLAVYMGVHLVRTHDVRPTLHAVRLVEFIREAGRVVG